MSVSFIETPPYKYMPGYNSIKYIADSTNKNLPGFRYVFDIYPSGTTTLSSSTRITELFIAPRLIDGYGVVQFEEIMQNYLYYDFDKNADGLLNVPNSWEAFTVYVGEAYGGGWDYDDYEFASSTGASNAHVQLRQFASATTHSFQIGDQINIVQDDGGALKPSISGLHTVIDVQSPYAIIIELLFGDVGSGPSIGGTVTYADNRRTVSRHQISASTIAFNGAIPFNFNWFESVYKLPNAPYGKKKFLTTCPSEFSCTPFQDLWFNFINDYSAEVKYVFFNNSNGDVFSTDVTNQLQPIQQIGVGPNNAYIDTAVIGTFPLVKDDTDWYEVNAVTSGGTQITTSYRINIDRRCTIEYNDETPVIVFLDRLGSFGSFTMQLKRKDTTKVDRQSFNKDNGFYGDVDRTEGGDTTYSINLERELEMNTNWMTEAESKYFDEMFGSPCVELYFEGQYVRVSVTDDSYETFYQRNKNLIKRNIKVKFANPDVTNI